MLRGEQLENFNLLQFFVDSYEERKGKLEGDRPSSGTFSWGRPRQPRVPYLAPHPKANSHSRVICISGHRNLPDLIGRYFPRNDNAEIQDFYQVSIMTLLKPWRNLATDLKHADESWSSAFECFLSGASEHTKSIISGIQYFHECQCSAKQSRLPEPVNDFHSDIFTGCVDGSPIPLPGADGHMDGGTIDVTASEEALADILSHPFSSQESRHALEAAAIAQEAGVFPSAEDGEQWAFQTHHSDTRHGIVDSAQLSNWKTQLENDICKQNVVLSRTDGPRADAQGADSSQVEVLKLDSDDDVAGSRTQKHGSVTLLQSEAQMMSTLPSLLNEGQRRAYDIITRHLFDTLSGKRPQPLRMILYGEGGTGKSKVIQTVTDAFKQQGE
jgi:hypothetical protein